MLGGCPPTMTRLSPLVSCTWCFVVMPRCLKWSNWWGWQMPLGRLTNSHADSTNVLNINVQGIRTTISPLLLREKTTNSQWCLPCDCCWKRNFCWKCNPWTAKCLCVLTKNPAGCDQTFQNHSNGWPHVRGCPPTMTRLSPLAFCMWWFVVMPRSLKSSQWWDWHTPLGRSTNSHADSINVLKINVQGIRTTISPVFFRGKTTNSQWCLPCDCCWKRNFCWKCNPWTAKCLGVLTKNPTRCDQTFQNHSHGCHRLGMPTNNDKTVTIGVLHVMVCGDATLLEM